MVKTVSKFIAVTIGINKILKGQIQTLKNLFFENCGEIP